MISFNKPVFLKESLDCIKDAIENEHISGDGKYTKLCSELLKKQTNAQKVLLTTSGSTALDMAAVLCGLKAGDEVIMPSFTFSSTANAVVLRGACPVFIDVRPDTMNMDEELIEAAITERTKAIAVVHYAGVGCEMDTIMELASHYDLMVIEDAAQGIMSSYKGKPLGTFGDFGCFSFHETKNFTMGEGGALIIRDKKNNDSAEILREKGTNRSKYFRGEIDKYSWVDCGSSYLPSEINSAYLYPQLLAADELFKDRMESYLFYQKSLLPLAERELIELPFVPEECSHNAHIFYIKLKDLDQRTKFINHMNSKGIKAPFHYVPLHSSEAGVKYGRFNGQDVFTTKESERLVRLPLYHALTAEDREYVVEAVYSFFNSPIKGE